MAKLLKLRRGTTSQHSSFTGAEGEVTVDTTKDTLVVHDGSTAGGIPLAKEAGNITGNAATATTAGTVTTAAQTNITSTGTLTGLTVSGDVHFDNGADAGKDILWDVSADALEFSDNVKAVFGTDSDLLIYHDAGAHSYIRNDTNQLYIMGQNNVYLQHHASGSSVEDMLIAKGDGAVELYFDNSKKFETTSTGTLMNGIFKCLDSGADGASHAINLGTGNDLKLFHDGSNSFTIHGDEGNYLIKSGNDIYIRTGGDDSAIDCVEDGAVKLYHNNVQKIETTSTGVKITGTRTDIDTDGTEDCFRIGNAAGCDTGLRIGSTGTNPDTHAVLKYDKDDNYVSLLVSGESHGSGGILIGNGGFVSIFGGTTPKATLHVKAHDDNWEGGLLLEDNTGNDGWNFHPNSADASLLIGYNDDTSVSLTSQSATQVLQLEGDTGDVDVIDGNLKVASGHGIDFSATGGPANGTGTSELLDDYEEGTWTPQLGGSGNSFTYHADTGGFYTKIGKLVTCNGVVRLTARSGSNQLQLGNLPYAAGDNILGDSNSQGGLNTTYIDNSAAATHGPLGVISTGNDGSIFLYHQISSGNGSALNADEIDATFRWYFTFTYFA